MGNDNFLQKLSDARKMLDDEMVRAEQGSSKHSIKQLERIKNELIKMESIQNSNIFLPAFPRSIADSWDHTDPLGLALMKIYYTYEKL